MPSEKTKYRGQSSAVWEPEKSIQTFISMRPSLSPKKGTISSLHRLTAQMVLIPLPSGNGIAELQYELNSKWRKRKKRILSFRDVFGFSQERSRSHDPILTVQIRNCFDQILREYRTKYFRNLKQIFLCQKQWPLRVAHITM